MDQWASILFFASWWWIDYSIKKTINNNKHKACHNNLLHNECIIRVSWPMTIQVRLFFVLMLIATLLFLNMSKVHLEWIKNVHNVPLVMNSYKLVQCSVTMLIQIMILVMPRKLVLWTWVNLATSLLERDCVCVCVCVCVVCMCVREQKV